jgi:ADP-heptose:LPS heptosyltransferase
MNHTSLRDCVRRLLLLPLSPWVWGARSRPAANVPPSATLNRILIIKLDALGDAILLFPFLRRLVRACPAAKIDIICSRQTSGLWSSCPWINHVYELPIPRLGLLDHYRKAVRALRLGRLLRQNEYDCALIPRWDVDNGYAPHLAFLSQAPIRIGFSSDVLPEKKHWNHGYDDFLTHPIIAQGPQAEVEINDLLLDTLRLPPCTLDMSPWPALQETLLMPIEKDSNPRIAVAPFAAHPSRIWPISRYLELIEALHNHYSAKFLLFGGPDVQKKLHDLYRTIPSTIDLAIAPAKNNILESITTLRGAALFIGADSAPVHMAAAAGVPCVTISSHAVSCSPLSTHAPERFAPYGVCTIVCRPHACRPPCTDACDAPVAHCITRIGVAEVLAAACSILDKKMIAE